MNEFPTHTFAWVFVCILWVCSSLSLTQCAYSVLAAGGLIKRLVTLAINFAAILAFCLYS